MKLNEIYEVCGEWILEWPIVEQASERNIVKSTVFDYGQQVVKHLIKIYSWDSPRDYASHVKDINVWIDTIYNYRLKGNKYPDANDYYNWIMVGVPSVDYVTKQNDDSDYVVPRSGRSDEQVYEIIKTIIRNVSNDMGKRKLTHIKNYMIS
jgi:hypothetical protein